MFLANSAEPCLFRCSPYRLSLFLSIFSFLIMAYGVRHGVYVTGYTYAVLTNQSATIAYVTGHTYAVLTNQSAAIAYVTGHTYAVLTNQSAAIAYVTGCTYAVQPIRAGLWRTSRCVRHGVYVRFSTNQRATFSHTN